MRMNLLGSDIKDGENLLDLVFATGWIFLQLIQILSLTSDISLTGENVMGKNWTQQISAKDGWI